MQVDMQNFQPLKMFNHLAKGNIRVDSNSHSNQTNHINKKEVATDVVNNKLNEALGISSNTKSNKTSEFDFETVANNILSFVTGAISKAKDNGASDETLENMLSDAQKGLKEGLASASDELAQLGLLSAEITKGIDETATQLKNGLESFSEELFTPTEQLQTGFSSYKEGGYYNLTEDASFQFTTNEGDKVSITFNSDYQQQTASVLNLSEDSLDYSSSTMTSFEGSFNFEVNGDLNEDEQRAINELMNSLQQVSDLFFDGELEDAFDEATQISMDPTHLASFSMDLQRTETVVSIKEYQQVMPGKEIAQRFNPVNDQLAKAHEPGKTLCN
ncbi:DUF5610 domain-containing protein [Psychromonas sp. KJ10-10]|uniref:DUF5610 domain-containing protein n=1 Tax=Psychromonas sp. KJ10-10 TaxID=3391823 RepID=UPI0039B56C3D